MRNVPTQKQQECDLPPLSHAADILPIESQETVPDIGGYRILGPLGAGSMGTVWRALQISTRREVALKVMAGAAIGSEKARQRFEREVELTSRLEHPGIARLYDSGIHRNLYFYAMELIQGVHLDLYVRQHAWPHTQILKLFQAVAEALQYAHQNGVIHRDLKPSNILIDGIGQPHIVDFGLAKHQEPTIDTALISLNGDVAGTPAFMSPEQASGKTQGVDTRSDVYSLGAVLYLLLTNKYPVNTSGSAIEILYRVINEEVAPPRTYSKRIDNDLQQIVLKALSKRPEDRYSNAGALASDIHCYLRGEPVSAHAPTLVYVVKKTFFRHRIATAIVGCVTAVVATICIYASVRITAERNTAFAAVVDENIQRKRAEVERDSLDRQMVATLTTSGYQLISDNQWADAKAPLLEARKINDSFEGPSFLMNVGLFECFLRSPVPLARIISKSPFICSTVSPDSTVAVGISAQNRRFQYKLPSGIEDAESWLLPGDVVKCSFGEDEVLTIAPLDDLLLRKPSYTTLALHPLGKELPVAQITLPGWPCLAVALSHHEHNIAAVCTRRKIIGPAERLLSIGNLYGDQAVRILSDHKFITALDFSVNDDRLVTIEDGGIIRSWQLSDGTCASFNTRAISAPERLVSLPDNNVVVAFHDGSVSQWDLNDGNHVRTLAPSGSEITSLVLSPDHLFVVAGDDLGSLRVWNGQTGILLGRLEGNQTPITSLAFSTDNKIISSTHRDGSMTLWPIPGRYGSSSISFQTAATSIAISRNHHLAIVGLRNGIAAICDVSGGNILCLLGAPTSPVSSVAFSPDTTEAVVAHIDGTVLAYSLPSGALLRQEVPSQSEHSQSSSNDPYTRSIKNVLLSPDAAVAIEISTTQTVLRSIPTGETHLIAAHSSMTTGGFSSDGTWAFVFNANGHFTKIKVANAAAINVTIARCEPPGCGAIGIHGALGLLGSYDGTLTLLDLEACKQLWSGNLHCGAIKSISFCSGDQAALITSDDGSARLWDINSRRLLCKLQGDGGNVLCATISPDENIISVWGSENSVRFWSLRTADVDIDGESLVKSSDQSTAADAGRFYAATGFDGWAIQSFSANEQKLNVSDSYALARCYWHVGKLSDANRVFKTGESKDETSEGKIYAESCLYAIKSQGQR